MGKKRYDSSSDMSYGGGNKYAMPKANPLVGHTDTKVFKGGYDPGMCDWGSDGKSNVTGSRLNKGGDKKWRGTRKGKSY